MKEQKVLTLSSKSEKLNLLQIGSEYYPFPIYLIRKNRKQVFVTSDRFEALNKFKSYMYYLVSEQNQLFE